MGCTCSSQFDKAKEDDIVGEVGRAVHKVKETEVPEERDAMVALEVAASRHTLYRKRIRRYKPDLELDYNKSVTLLHLRNLLDEPVGRFYLKEFACEKNLPEMITLVDAWVRIHSLKTHKPLSLATVMKQAALEDQKKGGKSNPTLLYQSNGGGYNKQNTDTGKILVEMENGQANFKDSSDGGDPAISDGITQFGYPVQYPTAEEISTMVKELIHDYLEPSSDQYLGKYVDPNKVAKTLEDAQAALLKNQIDDLRHKTFLVLQNTVFIRLVEGKYSVKFREHSEYKRYKNKFQKCYNTLSHRDFDFMSTLGKGSFGRVIRIRKKTTGAQFALKVMSKKKILSGAESTEQVTVERNVLVACDCPSIVNIEFTFQTTRALFLALELLEGGTLVDAMQNNGGTLFLDQTIFIAAQMILGLEHLHKHGILYRDLKPMNVMLDLHGNAVLTDMGLAAKFRDSQFPKDHGGLSSNGSRLVRRKSMQKLKPEELKCVGTFGYRAPEILAVSEKRNGYGEQVDFWALGVCIHYVLTNRLPFNKKSSRTSAFGANLNPKDQERKLHKEPLQFPKDMDPTLCSLLYGLLELDPKKRLGNDVAELKAHPFFNDIDWKLLEERKLQPVYRPPAVPTRDPAMATEEPMYTGLQEAMQQFTQDNVLELFGGENEMTDEYAYVGHRQQRLFRDWDFVPDRLLVPDWEKANEDRLFD